MSDGERAISRQRRMFSAKSIAGLGLVLLHPRSAGASALDLAEATGGGPGEDRAAVAAVLREYLRVTDDQSQASIGRSFHRAALLMSSTRDGTVNAMTQATWWHRISAPRSEPIRRASTIRHIDVVGAAAIARVDIVTGESSSSDFFTLLRLSEGWRIVNKVLSSTIG